jgi:hypothetical protein
MVGSVSKVLITTVLFAVGSVSDPHSLIPDTDPDPT